MVANTNKCETISRSNCELRYSATLPLLCFVFLNLAGSICFKEGGTDGAHRWFYFVCGNAFGIACTWFMMQVYRRLNVNVAMSLGQGLGFLSVQAMFWLVYQPKTHPLQWLGIGLVLLGLPLAVWQRTSVYAEARP